MRLIVPSFPGTANTVVNVVTRPVAPTKTQADAFGKPFSEQPRPIQRTLIPQGTGPQEVVGKSIKVDELRDVFRTNLTWAIVGLSGTGKTALTSTIAGLSGTGKSILRNRLAFEPPAGPRAQDIRAHVVALQTDPPTYMTILDGRADQQLEQAELCNCLCLLTDHNKSNLESSIEGGRLAEHEAFLKQIRDQLDKSHAPPKLLICFLINKHDLWKSAKPDQISRFEQFWDNEVDKWRQGGFAKMIKVYAYSNRISTYVEQFKLELMRVAELSAKADDGISLFGHRT